MKIKNLFFLLAAMSISTIAMADVDGKYIWKRGKATKVLEVNKIDNNTIKFSMSMGEGVIGGCGGMIDDSIAELRKNIAIFKNDDGCSIKMLFKKNGAEVSEEGDCTYYHGPACEFSEKYNKVNLTKTSKQSLGIKQVQKYCTEMENALRNVKTIMEGYYADNQQYPTQIPWGSYKPAKGVSVELLDDSNESKYTIRASHINCDKVMYITDDRPGIVLEQNVSN